MLGVGTSIEDVRAAVARIEPRDQPQVPDTRKAAVAAVFRDAGQSADLLFIRRAAHPRDPWSGHMAFPGGRIDETDASPLAAAIREAREELSLDLERDAVLIGRLSEARTHLRPGGVPRSVVPFAFELRTQPELVPNGEVEEALWVPLAFLADRANRRAMTWIRDGTPLPMPCYRWEGRVIWGLTLRFVDELLGALDPR